MDERTIIKDRIKKKEQEIQSLEDKLRTARIYIQALNDVMKVLQKTTDDTPAESVLRPGSTVSQARDVIFERGKPVHINELLEALGKEVTREGRASLTSSLAAYVRREEIFTRPAPNTFGLIELGHTQLDFNDEPEPPKGFGSLDGDAEDDGAEDDEHPF